MKLRSGLLKVNFKIRRDQPIREETSTETETEILINNRNESASKLTTTSLYTSLPPGKCICIVKKNSDKVCYLRCEKKNAMC